MKTIVIILKFLVVSTFLMICFLYISEKNISYNNDNLKTCKIIKKRCWHGKRGGSVIWVLYNQESYKVSINSYDCDKFNVGNTIRLYYDSRFDYFFIKNYINIGWVILTFILVIVVFMFKHIDKFNNKLKKINSRNNW